MEQDHATQGVVDSSFVRKDFYLAPPEKGASPEVWQTWLKAERNAAAQAKRAYTKAQSYAELPESARPRTVAKIGGVWRQCALVGLVGSADDGSTRLEAAVEASQERSLAVSRMTAEESKRGSTSKARSARRRALKRQFRNRRFGR